MTRQRWLGAIALTSALTLVACLLVTVLVRGGRGPTASVPPATARAGERATATRAASPTSLPAATPTPRPPTASPTSLPDPVRGSPTPDGELATTLAAIEAAAIPPRDLYELAIRFGKISDATPRVVSESDPGYVVGDVLTFRVSNLATSESFNVEATLQAQSAHASWWVANDVSVDQEDLEASARVFEEETYPTNRAIFGSEWQPGVDGDPRVHIFLGEVPGVGGYFSSADEFPRSVNPNSNEKEIFYLNFNNAQPGDSYFDGILAHEFQHMIHWNIDRNEELWINEGLSELAAQLNGFEVGSGPDAFARDTDIPVTRWSDQSHPFYGSAFLFMNYFYQRFGQEAISEFITTQADGPAAFDEVLAKHKLTFDAFYAEWVVANLLNDRTLEDGRYGYTDDSLRPPDLTRTIRKFPVVERAEVYQYGSDYLRMESSDEAGTLILEFEGDTTVPLLPSEAHDGTWMLWSNRGDDGQALASRSFDLSGLDEATLSFWAWYDLEQDYDYAYVSVSTDEGQHWQILPATTTGETNPHGNNFGHAFTGKSGQPDADEASEPRWREQRVDLTPFTGQKILVGFHTITDDALNYNGFAVDDIAIPELDYAEGFEGGDGGWQSQGFARVDNLLPQHFIVQVVAEGSGGTRILPVELDATNRATLAVEEFGTAVDRVTLIVTGATSFTSEVASYSYSAYIED